MSSHPDSFLFRATEFETYGSVLFSIPKDKTYLGGGGIVPSLNFRYFSNSDVIFRLINNLVYHKDFQFPSWNLEE